MFPRKCAMLQTQTAHEHGQSLETRTLVSSRWRWCCERHLPRGNQVAGIAGSSVEFPKSFETCERMSTLSDMLLEKERTARMHPHLIGKDFVGEVNNS